MFTTINVDMEESQVDNNSCELYSWFVVKYKGECNPDINYLLFCILKLYSFTDISLDFLL